MDKSLKKRIIRLKLTSKTNGLYVSMDKSINQINLPDTIAEKLSAHTEIVELANNDMTDSDFLDIAKKVKQLCEVFNATLILHQRTDIAYLCGADSVCVDENSIDLKSVKKIVGEECLIGVNIKEPLEKNTLTQIVKDGVDYLIMDNLQPTPFETVMTVSEYAKWVSENSFLPVIIRNALSENVPEGNIIQTTLHTC